MGYSLFGGFIGNGNVPGAFRIRAPLEQYKTRGVFQQEHPSCFVLNPPFPEVWQEQQCPVRFLRMVNLEDF
jgi:hypothetical protein